MKKPKLPFEVAKIKYDNKNYTEDISKISLYSEPEQKDGYLKGTILAERLKEKGLNASTLDYLLEHQELIPEEWKNKIIYAWGTIFSGSGGDLCVRYAIVDGGRWVSDYDWLDSNFYGRDLALVSANNSDTLTFKTPDYCECKKCEHCGKIIMRYMKEKLKR